jgi:hypothetical protein
VGFNDVTTGNNDLYNVGGYSAGVGYDMASGLGSPDGTPFIAGLCPSKVDLTKSTFSAPSVHVAVNTPANVSVTLRDANGNPIANAQVGVSASAASGTIEINGVAPSATPGQASATVTSSSGGAANFTLTSSVAGAVTLTISFAGTTLHTTTITFGSAHVTGSVPGRPKISTLTSLSGGFTLVVAPDAAGSSPITQFQYSINAGATWASFSASTRSVSVRSLLKAHTYVVIVRARNATGLSAPSAPSKVTTRP